jgi:hypothetical protein
MQKKLLLFLAMILCSAAAFSQTKKIAHRSHSGTAMTFRIDGPDNFGTTPAMIEEARKKKAEKDRTDSLAMKAKADSLAMKVKTDSLSKPRPDPGKLKPKHKRSASTKVVTKVN